MAVLPTHPSPAEPAETPNLLPFAAAAPAGSEQAPPRRKKWGDKFRVAFRGLKLGIRGHSSFAVHFFFTALVLVAATALHLELVEWCVILGCIGLVLVAELFNSAIETLFRGQDEATRARTWPALDVAAGAVLLASLFAAVIGTLVFAPKVVAMLINVYRDVFSQ
jgi:diacylglycerol kinase